MSDFLKHIRGNVNELYYYNFKNADQLINLFYNWDYDFNDTKNHLYSLYNPPYDKESFYYRRVFESSYEGRGDTIPYYWRHPFCDGVLDPSARLLSFYETDRIHVKDEPA